MNGGPMVYISNDDADAALSACGPRGLVLYIGLCTVAPPDGTEFTTSYEMLAYRTHVPVATIKRLLPELQRIGVVAVTRVARHDLDSIGFFRCQIREVSEKTIRDAHFSGSGAPQLPRANSPAEIGRS